ncbi:hypothetical protein C8J57DRAFT_1250436 [Mycena rebaudengoi]|nr:hypothetical protein C8J57DRAFT_1250436 [Mycena rebaudengoi]
MGRSDSPDPALARSTSPASFSEPNNFPFIPVIADETQSAFRTTGHQVFTNLRKLMETISRTVPLATEAHPLYAFSGDPLEYFRKTLLPEDWEHILLSKIVAVVRKRPLSEIPRRGHMGLDGFRDFLEPCIAQGLSLKIVQDIFLPLEDIIVYGFSGILNRIANGVHENTPLAYQSIEQLVEIVEIRGEKTVGLRLMRLNDSKRLFRIMAALDNYKELIMAIASGRISRISNILASGLRDHAGVMGLALLFYRAVKHQFKAENDTAEKAVGHLFLRLGGVSTLRRNTVIRPLLPSSGRPTVQEIEANIDACLEAGPDFSNGATVLHVILMLDEIATEHRLRYDDRNSKTQTDLEMLREGIRDGRAHLTGETTFAGIGPLDRDPRRLAIGSQISTRLREDPCVSTTVKQTSFDMGLLTRGDPKRGIVSLTVRDRLVQDELTPHRRSSSLITQAMGSIN